MAVEITLSKVEIFSETNREISFKDFPDLAIWSKPGAPFICIEPWFSTADKIDSNGVFEEKDNLIELKLLEYLEVKN